MSLRRDSNPAFNNCALPTSTDTQSSLVSEVSIFHRKGKNTDGEIWTFSDASRGVSI